MNQYQVSLCYTDIRARGCMLLLFGVPFTYITSIQHLIPESFIRKLRKDAANRIEKRKIKSALFYLCA